MLHGKAGEFIWETLPRHQQRSRLLKFGFLYICISYHSVYVNLHIITYNITSSFLVQVMFSTKNLVWRIYFTNKIACTVIPLKTGCIETVLSTNKRFSTWHRKISTAKSLSNYKIKHTYLDKTILKALMSICDDVHLWLGLARLVAPPHTLWKKVPPYQAYMKTVVKSGQWASTKGYWGWGLSKLFKIIQPSMISQICLQVSFLSVIGTLFKFAKHPA